MSDNSTNKLVKQKLEAHDLNGAIEAALASADEAKAFAQDAIASLDEGLDRLNKQADAMLAKYELL
jgi:hypothetical protein